MAVPNPFPRASLLTMKRHARKTASSLGGPEAYSFTCGKSLGGAY